MDLTYLKGVLKYIVSAVISVVIVWYVLYHLTGGYSPSVETSTAVLTTAEETLTSTAVIMRNEQIIYSTTKGNINYLVDDEVRVPMGQEVAQVFSSLPSFGGAGGGSRGPRHNSLWWGERRSVPL